MADVAFPPEPWFLGGSLLVSTFLVAPGAVPGLAEALPDGHRPVLFGGRAVVGVATAEYTPGGALTYDELLVAVLTTSGRALRVTIPQIWVTSAASAAGGRALWGIPKRLAKVTHDDGTQVRLPDGAPVVRLDARMGARLAPTLTFPLPTAQRPLTGPRGAITSHNRVTADVRLLHARWDVAPGGPLVWLAGHRPLLSVALTDAAITFGRRVTRP